MGFLGVYKAVYDYAPQGEGELAIAEGDVLYVLEKSQEDDWWKAKKRASAEDDDEPEGLVPNNYVEEVCITPISCSALVNARVLVTQYQAWTDTLEQSVVPACCASSCPLRVHKTD